MHHFRVVNEVLSTRTEFVYLRKLDHTDASVNRVRFAFHGHVSLRWFRGARRGHRECGSKQEVLVHSSITNERGRVGSFTNLRVLESKSREQATRP